MVLEVRKAGAILKRREAYQEKEDEPIVHSVPDFYGKGGGKDSVNSNGG